MASRNYPRLDIVPFGTQLIKSGDIDPIYIMLVDSKLPQDQIKRWMVAYWCFYNAGFASYMSEFSGEAYWDKLAEAAANTTLSPLGDRWPRGKERRHYRGASAIESVAQLRRRYPAGPEKFVDFLMPQAQEHFLKVSERVKQHYLFGDWIAFKVCDMLERILGAHIGFDQAGIFMFKDPEKAAYMLFDQQNPGILNQKGVKPKREKILFGVTNWLQEQLGHLPAPPRFDRQINIQEIETVLCKYKSHMNGHYPLNNDLEEIAEGLHPWANHGCATAQRMLEVLPEPMPPAQPNPFPGVRGEVHDA